MADIEKLRTKVAEMIAMHLGVEPERVMPDADLVDDLGADSLDKVELAMTLEEEFHIAIPDGEESNLATVRDWQQRVERDTAAQ